MIHLRKSMVEEVLGGPIDVAKSVPTYDEFVRLTGELNKLKPGVAGVGLMGARGFWATYTWEDIAAQHGVMLFDDDCNPTLNSDAGVKAMEIFLALQKNAIEGVSGAGWGENRAAWLGGQVAVERQLAGQRHPGDASRPEPDRRRLDHDLRAARRGRTLRAAQRRGLDLLRGRDARRTRKAPS